MTDTSTWELRLALSVQQIVREQESLRAAIGRNPVFEAEYTAMIQGLNLALAAIGGTLGIVGPEGRMRLIEWADERTQRVV